MKELWHGPIEKIDDYRWRIPKRYNPGMRVPGIIYADENLLKDIRTDRAAEQVANVAHLPGIVKYSLAMPDIHWGYGAPIGGVAAFDIEKGIIAPGMIGYDINCGVRLVRTNFIEKDVKAKIRDLVYALFNNIPSGVGSKGKIRASGQEERKLLIKGAQWAVECGYGTPQDLEYTEERGAIAGADPGAGYREDLRAGIQAGRRAKDNLPPQGAHRPLRPEVRSLPSRGHLFAMSRRT